MPSIEKLKSITPCRCELCGVGIGKSVFKISSVWKEYDHLFAYVFVARINGRPYRVDEWCYEDLARRHGLPMPKTRYT